jgi:hypothetical protein
MSVEITDIDIKSYSQGASGNRLIVTMQDSSALATKLEVCIAHLSWTSFSF